jgi:hypothetical protein
MNNSMLLFCAAIVLLSSSCGFSDEEKQAAQMACECASDKTIEGVRDCIRDAADSLNIDAQALSYDRAFREVCPDTYKRIMDFAKGKTKGRDEVPTAE